MECSDTDRPALRVREFACSGRNKSKLFGPSSPYTRSFYTRIIRDEWNSRGLDRAEALCTPHVSLPPFVASFSFFIAFPTTVSAYRIVGVHRSPLTDPGSAACRPLSLYQMELFVRGIQLQGGRSPLGFGFFLIPSTPHRLLAVTLRFDHDKQLQTTEGEGRSKQGHQ